MLSEGRDLVVLLAEFYPSGKHYTSVLVEVVDGPPTEERPLEEDLAVLTRFMMLVSFVNGAPLDMAAKAMGLDGGGEVDYFVAAADYMETQRSANSADKQDNEEDWIEKERDVDDAVDCSGIAMGISLPERAELRNQQEARQLADLVRGLKGQDAKTGDTRFHAAWLEPRYWLVD